MSVEMEGGGEGKVSKLGRNRGRISHYTGID